MTAVRWLECVPAPSDVPRRAPASTVLYAVGDIHGRLDLLEAMLGAIEAHARQRPGAQSQVIFLGDYLSRGQDSRGVVERILRWRATCPEHWRVISLKGNHEDLALRYLSGDLEAARHWFDYDGLDALRDYGVALPTQCQPIATPQELGGLAQPVPVLMTPVAKAFDDATLESLRHAFATALPATHLAFLESLSVSHRAGDYHFVHAGVRPGVALEAQTATDQMWIRSRFLASDVEHGALVVHGHTVAPQPQVRANRIGIDTGAYASGVLTCLVLEGAQRCFLQVVGACRELKVPEEAG
ncbi:MAG: serine/threonine protein phosphatase [Rhodoferax sp.]|nr:serine/threonine protein phosphatase [Rhodoferax sp.]MBK9235340.1 serine/threonine protein phosphatase [Rhodoferax sp.]